MITITAIVIAAAVFGFIVGATKDAMTYPYDVTECTCVVARMGLKLSDPVEIEITDAGVITIRETIMSDIELKRTIAQMDKAYTEACMDKRVLEGRIEILIAENAEQRSKAVEAEELLQAAERDLDRQDVEIAALKAANELLSLQRANLIDAVEVSIASGDSMHAENSRLRDVIVFQAAQLAGASE